MHRHRIDNQVIEELAANPPADWILEDWRALAILLGRKALYWQKQADEAKETTPFEDDPPIPKEGQRRGRGRPKKLRLGSGMLGLVIGLDGDSPRKRGRHSDYSPEQERRLIERFQKLKTLSSEIRGTRVSDHDIAVAWLTQRFPGEPQYKIREAAKKEAKKISRLRRKIEKLPE